MTVSIDRRLIGLMALVLAIHTVSFWTEIRQSVASFKPTFSEPAKVSVVPMSEKEWQDYKAKNQIVQTDDSGREEKPKDKAFLGEKDRSFDRQTVARKVDVFNKAAKGTSTQDSPEVKPLQKVTAKKKALKDIKLSDIGMEAMGAPEIQRAPASFAKKGLQNGDEKSRGLSSTNDYIEHVALGDFTQLNTVEYKYYGFFHRIRGKLEQFWGRTLKEKADSIYKSGRSIASNDQYTTALVITMNEQGEIIGVKVKSSSGVKELDEAAIESFNKAGPFPNPPKGLIVNGKATIEWGFVVQS